MLLIAALPGVTTITCGVLAPKLSVRPPLPEERGKGGVFAVEPIACMETIAHIRRDIVLVPCDAARAAAAGAETPSWAAELTAAALLTLHLDSDPTNSTMLWERRQLVKEWVTGGWATEGADLGNDEVRWGPRDVTGSLMATGSDNDKNIYAKFRFPCHPVVHRAGLGLAALTRSDKAAALAALECRGRHFRAMRDALFPLVHTPSPRPKGSARERRCWDVADTLSRVLSRATMLQLDDDESSTCAVVPLHERLAHCDARGENAKLVSRDLRGAQAGGDDHVVLVAARDIEAGEAITRDYNLAPRLPGDESDGALRLLLQFGLPATAWHGAGP